MARSRPSLCIAGLTFVTLIGCRTQTPDTRLKDEPVPAAAPTSAALADGPRLCAAVRGNGERIMAHFGALARIVEHFGPIDALAGGSSASVSVFLYESMHANPLVRDCGGGAVCDDSAAAERVALMLKSVQGYLQLLASTDEAVAFRLLAPILAKAQAQGIDSLVATDIDQGRRALIRLLESRDIKDIIDREALDLLKTSPHPDFHAREAWDSLAKLGSWDSSDPKIFVRPGLIDFRAVGRKVGRIANFYAGYGPTDAAGMRSFFDACAAASRGKTWTETAALPGPGGATCGAAFYELAKSYRTRLVANESNFPSRVNDAIGKYLPSLVMTALLEGEDAAGRFKAARGDYLAARPIRWSMDFDLVKIGYWGRAQDLDRVGRNTQRFDDIKSGKFVPLGEQPWIEALAYSPAEPGLTRLQEMSPTRVSAGGWPDLHPTLVLKNLDCQNVVYVTRQGEESDFIKGLTKLLGMSAEQEKAYFALDKAENEAPSSILKSVTEAEGVWCTDWYSFSGKQVTEISDHAFNAPFEARSRFFSDAVRPYPNARPSLNLRACTPGAPAVPM